MFLLYDILIEREREIESELDREFIRNVNNFIDV